MPQTSARLSLIFLSLIISSFLYGQKSLKELISNSKFHWLADSTSHRLTIYYTSDNIIASKIEKEYARILSEIDYVQQFMHTDEYRSRISLFVVNSRQQMKDLVGHETNGNAYYEENIVTGILSETQMTINSHEFFHTIAMNVWGVPDDWINEGMAVYCTKQWNGYDLYSLAKYLIDKGRYTPLERITKNLRKEDPSTLYPLLGSFMKYLDETYGLEKVVILWKDGSKALKKSTKKSLKELETEWLARVQQVHYNTINH